MKNYNLRNINIAVLDGHKTMRTLLRSVIKALGIEHINVSGNSEEISQSQSFVIPDLIFADWSPNLDGVNFVKQIRGNKSVHDRFIPIVMISAFNDLPRICAARDAGVTEYLAKPITAELIYRRICTLVEHPRTYVQSKNFFGPDRRRRNLTFDRDERRLESPSMPANTDYRSRARVAV